MTSLDVGFYRSPTKAQASEADFQAQLLQLAGDLGFRGAVYVQIGHAIPSASRPSLTPLRFVASVPNARGWYLNEAGELLDPNAAVAREGGLPYSWTTSDTARLPPMQAAFYAGLRRRAVISGVCAPVADYFAGPAYVSFYNAYESGPEEGLGHDQMAGLSFAAHDFHLRAKAALAGRDSRDSLTPREITCLRLGALGHTVAQTADALNVTPRTVEFHLKNAAHKFGAPNKLRAILIAMREGLIEA